MYFPFVTPLLLAERRWAVAQEAYEEVLVRGASRAAIEIAWQRERARWREWAQLRGAAG